MAWPEILLTLAVPSLGLSWAVGYAREWVFPLLLLYYLVPLGLYGLGGILARAFPGLPLPRLKEAALPFLALLLPYSLFWVGAGFARVPVLAAYWAFLRGPGLAVPLVVLVAWPMSWHVPPFLASLMTLSLFLLGERSARWLIRRS